MTALLAIGANKVWGLSQNVDYVSGNFGVGRLTARGAFDLDGERVVRALRQPAK